MKFHGQKGHNDNFPAEVEEQISAEVRPIVEEQIMLMRRIMGINELSALARGCYNIYQHPINFN
jgi:hypothetical protein